MKCYLLPSSYLDRSIDTLLKIKNEPHFEKHSLYIKAGRLYHLAKLQYKYGRNNEAIANLLECISQYSTEESTYKPEIIAANDLLLRITSVLVRQTDGAMNEIKNRIRTFEQENDFIECIIPCFSLSVRYTYQNEFELARIYGEKALQYQTKYAAKRDQRTLNILGQLCTIYGNINLSERYDSCVELGYTIVRELQKTGNHRLNEFELGVLFGSYHLGRKSDTQFLLDSLENILQQDCKNRYQLTNIYEYRKRLAKEKGYIKRAAEFAYKKLYFATECGVDNEYFIIEANNTIKELISLEKSLGNTEKIHTLYSLQLKYDSLQLSKSTYLKLLDFWSEKDIKYERQKILNNKVELRQKLVLFGIFIAILIGFQFYNLKLKTTQHNMESYKNKIEISHGKMNPHFTFNVLTGLQDLILRDKKDEALEYLEAFSKITRNIFNFKFDDLSSISDEIAFLQKYMVLERGRFGDKLILESSIQRSIDQDHTFIPRLLCQPIVENSIKHGLRKQLLEGKEGNVNIDISRHPYLTITICDNGCGFPVSQNTKEGHSLYFVQKGLELFYTKKGFLIKEYNLNEGGACTEVHLYKV